MKSYEILEGVKFSYSQGANFMAVKVLELAGKEEPTERQIQWVERELKCLIKRIK